MYSPVVYLSANRRYSVVQLTFLVLCFAAKVKAVSFNSYPYLYFDEKGHNASYPVEEHIAPKGDRNLHNDRPDFLYKPHPGTYRVVEFYVHWCNICRHFSKHYVKYSRKVQLLVADKPDVAITFHGISCVPNRVLCRKQEIPGYPMLKLFKPGDIKGVTIKHTEAKPIAMLQTLGISVDGMKDDVDSDEPEPDEGSQEVGSWRYSFFQRREAAKSQRQHATYHRTKENLKNDIHLSFDFAMRNSVFIADGDDTLSKEAKDTLKAYLILMQRTLPPSWTELQALLVELVRNFRYVVKKEPYLIKFLNKYPPNALAEGADPEWSLSCSRGVPGRGFTCGLWEMFHAVTVGTVDYNRNQVEDANLVAPEAVAKIIRDFVEFFFSCEECRQNFLKMYDSCAFGRCDRLTKVTKLTGEKDTELEWQAVSLWLYEVHNAVNVRLMNEKATREKRVSTLQDVVDVQFPSMRECRPCWLEPDAKGNRKWNETAVFNYLKLEYGQRDSYIVEFQRQLQEANSAADNDNQKLRAVGPKIAASQVLHPIILFVCIIGYIGFGGCGNIYWRRAFFQRKLRTL